MNLDDAKIGDEVEPGALGLKTLNEVMARDRVVRLVSKLVPLAELPKDLPASTRPRHQHWNRVAYADRAGRYYRYRLVGIHGDV